MASSSAYPIVLPPANDDDIAAAVPSSSSAAAAAAVIDGPATTTTTTTKLSSHRISLSPDYTPSLSTTTASSINEEDDMKKEEEEEEEIEEDDATSAPAARDPSTNDPPQRRSGRKRTSTTMIIDGHVVKTSNNYVVTGVNYVHGAYKADAPREEKKARQQQQMSAVARPAIARVVPEHVARRSAHNDAIRGRAVMDDSRRLDFMAENVDVLEPFLDDEVRARLSDHREEMRLVAGKLVGAEEGVVPPLASQPDIVVTPLRDYQMIGLEWMVLMHSRGLPFVLGDEMGLGKTLQTIALIAHLRENVEGHAGPTLVVCPLSVLYSWCAELDKHAPTLKHFRFHSSCPKEREVQKHTMLHDVLSYDVVVTTYDMVKNPLLANLLSHTHFNLCVLDEGHVIKSMTSLIAESVRRIHCQCRVVLTGTPLQNNLVELYAILNYLYPQYFTTPQRFESAFDIGHNRIDPDMLLKANRLLKLFMIRRLKDEVEKLMPKKIETKVRCVIVCVCVCVCLYVFYLLSPVRSLVWSLSYTGA
jgi:SWI/SNF-related matrix-associated actin-dependent regulator of chromatin subfamily A member 5